MIILYCIMIVFLVEGFKMKAGMQSPYFFGNMQHSYKNRHKVKGKEVKGTG